MNKIKSIVVFGGNGWVGTSVVRALLRKGASVTVVSRTGAPKGKKQEWHDNVNWRAFNLENYKDKKSKTSLLELLTGEGEENGGGETTCGVVSCVGTFGDPPLDQESMYEQNGLTNAFLATTAKEAGVKNFSFISAHQYPVAKQTVFKGYYRGKLHAETTIQSCQFDSCTILRPGFISGTRDGIPLWLAGTPMSTLFRSSAMKAVRSNIPSMVGDFLETPIDVDDVGVVAAVGALGELDQGGVYGDLDPLTGVDIARMGETYT